VFIISGCQEEKTYEDLFLEFQEHLEANHEIYQEHLDFFNTASTQTIKTIVMVSVNIIPTNALIRASGVIFDEDDTYYYVLTNHHVVHVDENEQAIYRVFDYQGNIYQASLVVSDPSYDLAILKFTKALKTLEIITFSENDAIKDDYIMIMGYPNIRMVAMTMGAVVNYDMIDISNINENIIDVKFEIMISYAPVNFGSSGSLVINGQHALVGIVFSAYIPTNDDISEATFIIPLSKVKEFLVLHNGGDMI
jgi:S1-C subfamily serine protease